MSKTEINLDGIVESRVIAVQPVEEGEDILSVSAIKGKNDKGKWRYIAYIEGTHGKEAAALAPAIKAAIRAVDMKPEGYNVADVKESDAFPTAGDNKAPEPKTFAELSDQDKAIGEASAIELAGALEQKAAAEDKTREMHVTVAETFNNIRTKFDHKKAFGLWWDEMKGRTEGALSEWLGREERGKNYAGNMSMLARIAEFSDLMASVPGDLMTASSIRGHVEQSRGALAAGMAGLISGDIPQSVGDEWSEGYTGKFRQILSAVVEGGIYAVTELDIDPDFADTAEELARLHYDNWGDKNVLASDTELTSGEESPKGVLTVERGDELGAALIKAMKASKNAVQVTRDNARAESVKGAADELVTAAKTKAFEDMETAVQARHLFNILSAVLVEEVDEDDNVVLGYDAESVSAAQAVIDLMNRHVGMIANGEAIIADILSGEVMTDGEAEDETDSVE